ncbi:Mg2+ transporter protein CorA-like/Zinc transport protein ZntB [Penicillium lagena]|uniref:Mg2+ transporter protein CorA-like/Zinc transport protein ZntB n=1 Tax=Penicillium lagena TaxID=94218 RepID=UPI0025401E0D|nr:Mg2+ transporter protein CorA-like/Zinc transport protein ZntB [Penicillium lagena]KAJ5624330.1 Mg2+ transporter protein CorA-like/Zinc transport protein ZntB [Penicillium lagena]
MNEHDSDAHSSTNGSDGVDSVAGSPTESVHSYVRPRPQRGARVAFAPPDLSSTSSATTSEFVRPRPRSPSRPSYRSRLRTRSYETIRIPARADWDDISPPRYKSNTPHAYTSNGSRASTSASAYTFNSSRPPTLGLSSGPDYFERHLDEDDTSPPRYNSEGPERYEDVYENDFDEVASDFPESFLRRPTHRRRGQDISTFAISNASRRPQYLHRDHDDLADDSDEERFTVHHVINVHPSRSAASHGNEEQKWLGSRVFTHQSSFNHDEKAFLETYHIIQSRLIPRSEDELHDRAILTYEEKAASSKTEIQWVITGGLTKALKMEALRQQNIPETTSILIRSAFRYLRQRNEKSYVHGRFLDPTALSFVARDDDDEILLREELASIAFLAFPYFSLEPLHVEDPSPAEPIHPVRSLLQFHYSFQSTGQRDTDQVVRKVLEVSDVLHVPQTWMLLINEGMFQLTGHEPERPRSYWGEYVSLEKAKVGGAMPQIRLIDFEGKQYFLPKRSCQTWLEFISMFSSMEEDNTVLTSFINGSWSDEYELRLGNELISEANWSETVLRAESDITIYIVEKPPRPLPRRSRPSRSYNSMLRKRSSIYSASNITRDDILVRHPMYISSQHRDDGDSIRQYHTNAVKRHAWQSDKKPIRLKDLNGFELSIPWRVGKTWRKMQSVIGTKMQQSYVSRRPYTNGDYILIGPDGPITPAEWDEKIRPGCTVELKLTGPETIGRMSRPRSRYRDSRSDPGDENSINTAVQPYSFTPRPLERIDTSRQIEYPGNSSDGVSARDANSETPGEPNESASVHDIENVASGSNLTMRAIQPEPSSQMSLVLRRNSPLNLDTNIYTATGEQHDGVPRLSRRSTGTQSFVEDFDEDTAEDSIPTEKTSSVDFAYPLPSVGRASGDRRGLSLTTRSDKTSSSSTESSKRDSSSQLASPEEPAADAQPETGKETTRMCPIFAWKVATGDDLPPTLMETSEPMFGYKDADGTIRAILEEREAEATLYLLKHGREKYYFDSIPECSRREVLAEMKVVDTPLDRSSAAERSVGKKSTQKKLKLISNAIEILDAFVPVQYQNNHQYLLIKKFYGALLAITSGYFNDAYLDKIGGRISAFLKYIRQIHARVSHGVDEQHRTFYLPKALVDAFNPMIIYVCISSQEFGLDWGLLDPCARKTLKSLKTAEYQLISMIHAGDFSEAKVFRSVNAQDIVTMVTERLVRIPNENTSGISLSDGFNLLQIYRQYILGLELQARTSPNAEIFDEIQRLREELNIVHTVLDQQLEVLDRLRTVWTSLRHPRYQISLQSIRQSRRLLKQMKCDLDELELMSDKTSMLLRSMIEVRKESNSKAIAIFTIVTVIFLPLSFVTSYLGMNSVDIRDGTFNQSLFWIAESEETVASSKTAWISADDCILVLRSREYGARWFRIESDNKGNYYNVNKASAM